MEIIAGDLRGHARWHLRSTTVEAGSAFDVAGNSGFTITVEDGICEYICSFLAA